MARSLKITKKTDPYLQLRNCKNRLIQDYIIHGSNLIVACDFDNTLYDFHHKGFTFTRLTRILQRCRIHALKIVIFTASEEERIPEIAKYLQEHSIPFDAINKDLLERPGDRTNSKIHYNILLDDRAGLPSAFATLLELEAYLDYPEINHRVENGVYKVRVYVRGPNGLGNVPIILQAHTLEELKKVYLKHKFNVK